MSAFSYDHGTECGFLVVEPLALALAPALATHTNPSRFHQVGVFLAPLVFLIFMLVTREIHRVHSAKSAKTEAAEQAASQVTSLLTPHPRIHSHGPAPNPPFIRHHTNLTSHRK